MGEFRPKTSAQTNRKIKTKRTKINPITTPANQDSKNKKKSKPAQSTSGSQLLVANRKPPKKFDFAACQEDGEVVTDRDCKRDNDSSQIIGLSKYKQNRMLIQTRTKSTKHCKYPLIIAESKNLSQSIQIGVLSPQTTTIKTPNQ